MTSEDAVAGLEISVHEQHIELPERDRTMAWDSVIVLCHATSRSGTEGLV
ncbi:MAG: hypothetical protein LBJ87_01010 [bacterium]|jgi:hypothetical protein|nr:hypothetical protein [bacterium]